MSQAIITKYLGATNSRGSRIRASCARGESLFFPYPHELEGEEVHRAAVHALVEKFAVEDEVRVLRALDERCRVFPWKRPFVTGQLASGEYVHVFMPKEVA